MRTPWRDTLAGACSPDGGWSYAGPPPGQIEPTALALIALAADAKRYAAHLDVGIKFLDQRTLADGSCRLPQGRHEAAWTTALALYARQAAGKAISPQSIDFLLNTKGLVVKADPEVRDMLDIDLALVGWPWAERTFSWTEPTAWSILTLRKLGKGDHPRVRDGMRLLLDRAFDSGGINYGNRMVLGKSTEPIPGPTALMLLALQGVREEPRIEAAKGYLRIQGEKGNDLEHLAWIKLALACHADDTATRELLPQLDAKLEQLLNQEVSPIRRAAGLLALEPVNPFQLSDVPNLEETDEERRQRIASVDVDAPPPAKSLGERVASSLRGFFSGGLGKLRALPPTSAVHIAAAPDYDSPLVDILASQFAHFREHVPVTGKRVVLKPNLVEFRRDKVINTDPRVIDAVITLLKQEGAGEILVAEGPGHWRNVEYLVQESGLGEVLRRHGIRFLDINHDEPVKVVNLGRTTGLDFLYMSKTVLSADVLISMPKLKTHHWAGATLSLKNLFGTLPGICYGWPKNELHWRGIPNSIVDIACTNTPHLAIVDGIIGMEGDGPLNGTAKPVGVLVMGCDLVAVDATCCRLMQLPVDRIPTLVLAEEKRLGRRAENQIPQLGAVIAAYSQAFEWPPMLEKQLIPV